MEHAFMIVVVAVGIVGILGAVIALLVARGAWESIGRDRLLMESDLQDPRAHPRPGPAGAQPPADTSARDTEIRQMLQARNRRRRMRGERELDIEAELARLTRAQAAGRTQALPEVDRELVAEIRQLVVARNHRRVHRGRPPLDVEAEIERQITRLNG